jgi:hypothetical protein
MELDKRQERILMHALGFEKGERSGRNFYLSISGSAEESLVADLFEKGLLQPHAEIGRNGLIRHSDELSAFAYSVTDLGVQTITEIVELQKKNGSDIPKQRKTKNGKDKRS